MKLLENTKEGISRFYILLTFFNRIILNKNFNEKHSLSYLKIDDTYIFSNIKYANEVMSLCMETPIVRKTGLSYFDLLNLYPYQFEALKTQLEKSLKTVAREADSVQEELSI